MEKKNFDEIAALWLNDKKLYVKRSTYAVYSLMVVNHLGPAFGKGTSLNPAARPKWAPLRIVEQCGTICSVFIKKLNKFQCADRPCRCVEGLF